jgi:type IV secretory pathway VirB10-like protein
MNEQEPAIQHRAASPPGAIPRNRQSLIMLAVAVVIVLAVVFSGSTQPPAKTDTPIANPGIHTPTKAEIDRYTQALRAEEERLRQAQADASRSRASFEQQINTGMQGGIPGQGVMGPDGQAYYPAGPSAPPVDAIAQEREKREYASLFASNVALSLRKESPPADVPNSSGAQSVPAPASPAEPDSTPKKPSASSPRYTLFEGTILEAVLTNRLQGDFTGPVNCQITTDVYSHNGRVLLIPKGSRVLGEARRVDERDQERLAVLFHRLLMPDGYSLSLDQTLGLDQAGAAALKDKVNRHYLSTFGTSAALGLLAGFSMYGTGGALTAEGGDLYRQGVASQLGRDATRILDHRLNRLPSVTIREGVRVKILLASDLALPAYSDHPEGDIHP